MRSFIWLAPMLAAALWLTPDLVRAQDTSMGHLAANSIEFGNHVYPASAQTGGAPSASVAASNGLQSMGSEGWPLVRKYIWASTFEGDELFAGYSQPLVEQGGDVVSFHLLIDRTAWSECDPVERQERLFSARLQFEDRLAELNLKGSLQIVLTSK